MVEYTMTCNFLAFSDGTYKCNEHDFTLIPHTVVCCWGTTIIPGMTLSFTENGTENGDNISKGLDSLI